MTNLDRLKGTPYLIGGLESFIAHWYSWYEPRQGPLGWTDEQLTVLQVLPEAVQEFYHMAHRWPQAWKTHRAMGQRGRLIFPPEVARWGQTEEEAPVIEAVRLVQDERYGTVIVSVKPGETHLPQCFSTDSDGPHPDSLGSLAIPLEEVLVTNVLMSMIIYGILGPNRDDLREATHVFTGRWLQRYPVDFYCLRDDELICDLRMGQGRNILPSYKPEMVCYYFE